MNIGETVKFYKKSENSTNWNELRNDRGDIIKAVIKDFSYSGAREPIFARVLVKEDDNLYFEELVSINSARFKTVRC